MHRLISILLADDNHPWRLDAARWLEESGFFVFDAGTGAEAVEKALVHSPDISILDMHMPDMTGLEVLRLFRAEGILVPCILVSADATQEIRLQALEEGAYTFLQKPVSPDLLRFTISRAFRSHFGEPLDNDPEPSQ